MLLEGDDFWRDNSYANVSPEMQADLDKARNAFKRSPDKVKENEDEKKDPVANYLDSKLNDTQKSQRSNGGAAKKNRETAKEKRKRMRKQKDKRQNKGHKNNRNSRNGGRRRRYGYDDYPSHIDRFGRHTYFHGFDEDKKYRDGLMSPPVQDEKKKEWVI